MVTSVHSFSLFQKLYELRFLCINCVMSLIDTKTKEVLSLKSVGQGRPTVEMDRPYLDCKASVSNRIE